MGIQRVCPSQACDSSYTRRDEVMLGGTQPRPWTTVGKCDGGQFKKHVICTSHPAPRGLPEGVPGGWQEEGVSRGREAVGGFGNGAGMLRGGRCSFRVPPTASTCFLILVLGSPRDETVTRALGLPAALQRPAGRQNISDSAASTSPCASACSRRGHKERCFKNSNRCSGSRWATAPWWSLSHDG